MKIIKEGLFNFTTVSAEQFFEELDKAKKFSFFTLYFGQKEPANCRIKNGTIHMLSGGISINSGEAELTMRKGTYLIDMTNQRFKTYRYESLDSWYCEIVI